jgi:hypothetical protein
LALLLLLLWVLGPECLALLLLLWVLVGVWAREYMAALLLLLLQVVCV